MCDRKNPSLHVCTLYIGIFAFKMATEIICLKDELPIVLITTLDLETFIKGHHVYKDAKTRRTLDVLMEPVKKWFKKTNIRIIRRGGCRGLPLLPMQHPEMADINFQS